MATVQKTQVGAQRIETRSPTAAQRVAAVASSNEKIAERAYQIWQASGRPDGKDQEHWFQAERELRAQPGRAR